MKNIGSPLLLLFISLCPAFSDVPSTISYQGRVQVSGTNFTGTGQFKFALISPGTNVSRQATAMAAVTSGFVTGITVTDGGGGYTSAPAVTINDPTGSGARALAQVSGGVVTNIAVQNAGSGYSSSPTVTIAPPPQTILHATFWSNDGTSSNGSEPASAVPVPVQQGLFTVFLGDTNLANMQPVAAAVFTQSEVHLRIWFNDGTSGSVQLTPDQRIGSVAYAMIASRVSEGGVSGSALTEGSVSSAKIENGTILIEDLSATLLNGAFWNLSGNVGTSPDRHFVGTTDNQPLEFRVNGVRALRIEPNTNGAPNIVGGAAVNFVTLGIVGATIGGGGGRIFSFGEIFTNSVTADFGTIGGGAANIIATNARASTIAGGQGNEIGTNSFQSTIAGGLFNKIRSNSEHCAIAGGTANIIAIGSDHSTIAGGFFNDIGANSSHTAIGGGDDNNARSRWTTIGGGRINDIDTNSNFATIGGGSDNNIAANSSGSTIAGGSGNSIGSTSGSSAIGGGSANTIGNNSGGAAIPGGINNFATNRAFAAGTQAKANHQGAFVLGDSTTFNISSTNNNSVTMRAAGGYRLFSNGGASLGVFLAPSGGSWTSISDRNAKENFEPVNARGVLEKVAALSLSTWNYKSQTNGVRHIGPMAQDFRAAFDVGESDTGITTVDADGVALAAIQGLNHKLQEELSRRDAENAELKERLEALEKIILNNKSN